MFSAISNLGAGGTQDIALSDIANGVLYGVFALSGLVSGGISNCMSKRLQSQIYVPDIFQCLVPDSLCSLVPWATRFMSDPFGGESNLLILIEST